MNPLTACDYGLLAAYCSNIFFIVWLFWDFLGKCNDWMIRTNKTFYYRSLFWRSILVYAFVAQLFINNFEWNGFVWWCAGVVVFDIILNNPWTIAYWDREKAQFDNMMAIMKEQKARIKSLKVEIKDLEKDIKDIDNP